ncbi:PBP1A family penicillin-binding protein [Bacillus mangrovi]|uniref:PBP1A family penicillin-binding protein n=1 Tax=Metabacillus mangrovi TaxID=1491830 RepID=A0A7X2S218_9BACI|nr:PBP1A family penicillin-binding protein [Metabacillus mangrovi]MTH52130.1 PBP1A family penicillin-binding protein [Metabacillus mangrovi]
MSEKYQSREERRRSSKPARKKSGRKNGPLWKKIAVGILAACVILMIAGGVAFGVMVAKSPSLDQEKLKSIYTSKVYDKDGNEIFEIGGEEKRTYVPYKDIPENVENAFLATEDARFYEHSGVDFIRLGGAVIANLKEGFGTQGGSTISQQVIKNYLLTNEKSVERKVQEVWLAFQLERKFSKQEIMELYLNKLYYTGNTYGIGKAAENFYGKEVKDLTLDEAAMLAGMVKAPNNYNPRVEPERAKNRRDTVLTLMVEHGFITSEEADQAKQVDVTAALVKPKEDSNPYKAFVEKITSEIKSKTDVEVSSAGLKIYTSIDPDAQKYVNSIMAGEVINLPDSEEFQTGLTLTNTQTGEIRALGGRGPQADFNYAIQPKRSPGSTIKPVLDYGPAVEYLKWSTHHQIVDEKHEYSNGKSFRNFGDRYYGKVSIREALKKSMNTPAVKTLNEVGLDKAKEFALGLGMPSEEFYESSAIGGYDHVSSMHMAGAYSAFGNGGFYIEPHVVKSVEYQDGTKMDLAPEPKAAMKDSTAFMVTDMLRDVLEPGGTGAAANVPGLDIAGKSGTSNNSKDSWFVGYTPSATLSVWTGKDQGLSDTEDDMARKIFKSVLSKTSSDDSRFKKPASVSEVEVLTGSDPAVKAGPYTPESKKTTEYFVKGTEPNEESNQFQQPEEEEEPEEEKPAAEKPSGLSVNYDQASNVINVSWDGQEGVTFEVALSQDGGPSQTATSTKGTSFSVSGPQPGSTYQFLVTAVSDSDGSRSEPAAASITVPAAQEPPAEDGQNPEEPPPADGGGNEGQEPPAGEEPPPTEPPADGGDGGQDDGGQGGGGQDDGQPDQPEQPGTPPPGQDGTGGTGGNGGTGESDDDGGDDD